MGITHLVLQCVCLGVLDRSEHHLKQNTQDTKQVEVWTPSPRLPWARLNKTSAKSGGRSQVDGPLCVNG